MAQDRRLAPTCVALLFLAAGGGADAAKPTRFWNLTDTTIKTLQLAPAGTGAFGPNQTVNDKDNAVDHDERLKILGVASGPYDVRLTDAKGRTCIVGSVPVKDGEVFAVEEKQLTHCTTK